MKLHLGGIVGLVPSLFVLGLALLPAHLSVAQNPPDTPLKASLVDLAIPVSEHLGDLVATPQLASRFVGPDGALWLAGGVELPSGPDRPAPSIRTWDASARRWVPQGTTLPAYDPAFPVAVTWYEDLTASISGVLSVGLSGPAGQQVATFNLDGKPLPPGTFAVCPRTAGDELPVKIAAPRFLANPKGVFGTTSEHLLYLIELDPNNRLPPAARLFAVILLPSAVGGGPVLCLESLLPDASLPADHLFGSITLDAAADGGAGVLLFAGGFALQDRNQAIQNLGLTQVKADGRVQAIGEWPATLTPLEWLPGSAGHLLLLATPLEQPSSPIRLVELSWDETAGAYQLLEQAAPHPIFGDPPAAIGDPRVLGSLTRATRLPTTETVLVEAAPAPLRIIDGTAPTFDETASHPGRLLRNARLQVLAHKATLTLPNSGLEFAFGLQVTLDGMNSGGWSLSATLPDPDPVQLSSSILDPQKPDTGIFSLLLSAQKPGDTAIAIDLLDGSSRQVAAFTLPVKVQRRESIYRGFQCGSSGSAPGGFAFGLLLLASLGLGLWRRLRSALLLTAALLLAPTAVQAADDTGPPRLAFLGVTPGAGVDAATAETISDYVQTLTAGTGGYRLIRITEVREMLGFEAKRQLLGCAEENCMSELAGTLDVERLLRASLSRLGESMMIQLTLLDGHKSRQIAATGMRLEKAPDAESVLDVMPELLNELFEADPRFDGKTVRHKQRNVRALTRERRWSFGTGIDLDLTHPGATLLGAHIAYRGPHLGLGLGLLPRLGSTPATGTPVPLGVRAEIRLRLFDAGPVHPQIGVGMTYFPSDIPLPRISLHTDIDFHRWVRGFVSVAGEWQPSRSQPFDVAYLLLSFGLAVTP